jgi:hypothetical protein
MSMKSKLKIGLGIAALAALMGCVGYAGAQTSPILSQPAAAGALLRRISRPFARFARKVERFKENCSRLRCSVRPLAESVEPEARRYNLERFCDHDFV